VVAILVGVLKCRTQFWKSTTQESFHQSLVEIGPVVSEEKIFFKFHPPFFLICIIGQNRQMFKVHKKSRNIVNLITHLGVLALFSSNFKKRLSLNCKKLQHVKIFLPCNFEENPITHFGVIALFSSKCSQF
jgi:hypothetical protein